MYLLNKLRSYPKPKPKKKANNTTTADDVKPKDNATTTESANATTTESASDDTPTNLENESDQKLAEPVVEETSESSESLGLCLIWRVNSVFRQFVI